jgi:hypothetical protein
MCSPFVLPSPVFCAAAHTSAAPYQHASGAELALPGHVKVVHVPAHVSAAQAAAAAAPAATAASADAVEAAPGAAEAVAAETAEAHAAVAGAAAAAMSAPGLYTQSVDDVSAACVWVFTCWFYHEACKQASNTTY